MIATSVALDVWSRLCRYVDRCVDRTANQLEDRLNPLFRRRMYRPGSPVLFADEVGDRGPSPDPAGRTC